MNYSQNAKKSKKNYPNFEKMRQSQKLTTYKRTVLALKISKVVFFGTI